MGIFDKSEPVNNNASKETTLISKGAYFKGDVKTDGNVHIDGKFEGNLVCKASISIGKSGFVKGDIKAEKLIVSGVFEGTADCDEIEILKDGTIEGSVLVRNIVIEKGGNFNGTCKKKDSNPKPSKPLK